MAAEKVTMILVGLWPETDSLIHTEAKGLQMQNLVWSGPDVQGMLRD
jgi:hypothetical protein